MNRPQHKVKKQHLSKAAIELLRFRYWNSREQIADMAEELGIHPRTINRHLKGTTAYQYNTRVNPNARNELDLRLQKLYEEKKR